MKMCKSCWKEKPEPEFYSLPHTSDGLNWRCIVCQNAYNREHGFQKALAALDPVVLLTFYEAPTIDRLMKFARKVARTATCWRWIGNLHPDNGYPRFWLGRHDDYLAHRLAYEWSGGTIPAGLTIDHLCRNRWCVNPDHLEPVTRGENNLRGGSPWAENARKTHCHRGHEFTAENTYTHKGMRHCRECARLMKRQARLLRARKAPPVLASRCTPR